MLKNKKLIIMGVCLFSMINIGSVFGNDFKEENDKTKKIEEIAQVQEYLKILESKDVSSIENEIKEKENKKIEQTKIQEQTTINREVQSNEKTDFKAYFKDTIFVGDSITEGISEYNLLNPNKIYAKKGNTLLQVKDNVEQIRNANPDRVIILLGMNDVVAFQDESSFKKEYLEYVNNIKKAVPNTKVVLESPTFVQAKAENKQPGLNNERLKKFQVVTKQVAEETKSIYVDLNDLVLSSNYYEQDGIHFKYNFYEELFKVLKNHIEQEK